MRKLGRVQQDVLSALREHGSWSPDVYGWIWDTASNTKRVMDSLVRAGYATVTEEQIERSMRHVGGSRKYVEERTVYRPINMRHGVS